MGWALLAAYVFAWDYRVALRGGGETLSCAFRRASRHPVARLPVLVIWTVTTLHLYGKIPEKYDPFILAARFLTHGFHPGTQESLQAR